RARGYVRGGRARRRPARPRAADLRGRALLRDRPSRRAARAARRLPPRSLVRILRPARRDLPVEQRGPPRAGPRRLRQPVERDLSLRLRGRALVLAARAARPARLRGAWAWPGTSDPLSREREDDDMSVKKGTGLLMVWVDVPADREEDFNRWYNEEHLAERLA